jgi:hypothetical protein
MGKFSHSRKVFFLTCFLYPKALRFSSSLCSFPLALCANCAGETALLDEIMSNALSKFTSPACRESTVLVHCSTGFLGNQGAKALADFGFRDVHALSSGLFDWQLVGYDIVLNDTFVEILPDCELQYPTTAPTAPPLSCCQNDASSAQVGTMMFVGLVYINICII